VLEAGADRGAMLLTGATGFVGAELLARLAGGPDRTIYALVRADDEAGAQQRVDAVTSDLFGAADPRVVGVPSDLTAPGLGLAGPWAQRLAGEVATVVHCAASVSFSMPLGESRQINVEGTKRILAFARRCRNLERVAYVSTAYVGGRHRGAFSADDLERGQRFRNPYEQSKQEAEVLVRTAGAELPVQVFRPSIVVGDRRTGWTSSFNVLYQPLRAFSRGMYAVLPGRMKSPVDVVPVDYVADGMCALMSEPAPAPGAPETHNLTSGADAASVEELTELAAAYFEREPPRIVDPVLWKYVMEPMLRRRAPAATRAVLEHSGVFFPYFSVETWFDDGPTRARLRRHGISTPSLPNYLPRLLDFAVATRWGKKLPPRTQVVPAKVA
jgi:thioester reductase-like protein